jgi:NitT/TauT family transport system substrate-binding protein
MEKRRGPCVLNCVGCTSWIPALLMLIGSVVGLPGWGAFSAFAAGDPLRIGTLPVTDVVPFYLAHEQGYFAEQGLEVELIPVASAAERDQLMVTGKIDGQLNDLISTVLFNAEKPRIVIVRKARCAFSHAPQIFILATKNSKIESIQDLKGVEIGISENSQIAYVVDRLLQREGFPRASIKTISVAQIPTRFQLLSQGQIQAAALPDPLASLAVLQGARNVLDDSRHPEVSQSVITFRAEVVRTRAPEVRKFLQGYDKAVQSIRTQPERFRNLLIEKARVPDPLKDKYQFPPFPDPSVPTQAQWEDVVQWALEKGIVKAPVAYATSVDPGFVK